MKTKILHIINDLSKNGGAQKFLVDLVMEHTSEYEIKVLVLCDDNDYLEQLTSKNIECFNWQTLSLKEKWTLLRWPDLVHGIYIHQFILHYSLLVKSEFRPSIAHIIAVVTIHCLSLWNSCCIAAITLQ